MTAIQTPSANPSCLARARDCLCENQVCKKGKFAFWAVGSLASAFIPVPFLNGFLAGSMFFMSTHEMMKLSPPGPVKRMAETRSWKHITAGATISGASWGLGSLSSSSALFIASMFGGLALSFVVAYSNTCCKPIADPQEYVALLPPIPEDDERRAESA